MQPWVRWLFRVLQPPIEMFFDSLIPCEVPSSSWPEILKKWAVYVRESLTGTIAYEGFPYVNSPLQQHPKPTLPPSRSHPVTTPLSQPRTNTPRRIRIKARRSIEVMNTTVTSDVSDVVVMTNIPGWVPPRPYRTARAREASLGTERRVLFERLRPIVRLQLQHEVEMADVTPSRVFRFKRETSAVSESGAYSPASLSLKQCGAGGRYDLRVYG